MHYELEICKPCFLLLIGLRTSQYEMLFPWAPRLTPPGVVDFSSMHIVHLPSLTASSAVQGLGLSLLYLRHLVSDFYVVHNWHLLKGFGITSHGRKKEGRLDCLGSCGHLLKRIASQPCGGLGVAGSPLGPGMLTVLCLACRCHIARLVSLPCTKSTASPLRNVETICLFLYNSLCLLSPVLST